MSEKAHIEHEAGTAASEAVAAECCAAESAGGKRTNHAEEESTRNQREHSPGDLITDEERLKVRAYKNRGGSTSFCVSGQLPLYDGRRQPDLRDNKNREILIPGEKPRFTRIRFNNEASAQDFVYRVAQAYKGVAIKQHLVPTSVPENYQRQYEKLHARLEPYLGIIPGAIEESGDLFVARYGNVLKPIGLRQLYQLMKKKEADFLGKHWLKKIGIAVNKTTRGLGRPIESYDAKGKQHYEVDVGALTGDKLQGLLHGLSYKKATAILWPLSRILDFAVEEGYVLKNVAEDVTLRITLKEKTEAAKAEIAVDDNAQVQIALNFAAKYEVGQAIRPGHFVPHVVFLYYAAMRPMSELRNMDPDDVRLCNKLIRVFSTKTYDRRVKSLPQNAVEMLEYYWDKKPLSWAGFTKFWRLSQALQGKDVKVPAWFKVPDGPKKPVKKNIPRHTGSSHGANLFADQREAAREDGHEWEQFKIWYDGLVPKSETAVFCSLWPAPMPLTDAGRERIRQDLIGHKLIGKDDTLPTPPTVPDFDVIIPQRQFWLPIITDEALRDLIWHDTVKKAAEANGTTEVWLLAICRAKRIPVPKAGRASRERPQDAPIPPPVTTKSNAELEMLIEEMHGIAPAAEHLGIREIHLRAHCAVHGLRLPSASARALFYNNRPKVRASRAQVETLLKNSSLDEAAAALEVTPECLRGFCQRHNIVMNPVRPPQPPNLTLNAIQESVILDLHLGLVFPLDNKRAMELVLSKAPEGLSEEDLALVVEQTIGIKLTKAAVLYVMNVSAKGRFERHCGRIRLVGPFEIKVDLDRLRILLKPELGRRTEWSLIEAVTCAVRMAPKGLSIDQLSQLLPLFNINLEPPKLKSELKRLDRRGKLRVYHQQVTIPEAAPDRKVWVRDKEPTADFEAIKERVQNRYAELANREFTNVEAMQFVLSMAPNGLWRHEFLDIAASCGIDFKMQCIHSVVEHEAKGQFECQQGKVRFIGLPEETRATITELRNALPVVTACPLPRVRLILEVLKHFAQGLHINELQAAAEMRGHKESRDTFRRQIYNYESRGWLKVVDARVWLSAQGNGAGTVTQEGGSGRAGVVAYPIVTMAGLRKALPTENGCRLERGELILELPCQRRCPRRRNSQA